MDPSSFSVSNDPHHPPQFTPYPPFPNSNPYAGTNQHFFGGAANHAAVAPPNDNHLFHALPQAPPVPPLPHPSIFNHPPYSDMICTAIAALNEPDGSSKQAISRYIERIYTGLPPAHGALLTHHLKTLKNSGVLMMVKKSYKFVATPPASVAVAAAAAAAGLEPPRSDFTSNTVNENKALPDPAATSTPQTQKRGRGRPPKPKPEVTLISDVQTNGKPTWEPSELPVFRPEEELPPPPIKRPPGRPRKVQVPPTVQDSPTVQASPAVQAAPPSIARRRGRPPSGRAAGRERKPTIVSAPVSVIPYVANGGVRRRGRPRRVDAGASSSVAPPLPPNAESGGGEGVGLVVVKRRGRGRPPKIGGVTRKLMKPMRRVSRTGRPLGRPRKVKNLSLCSQKQC